MRQRYPLLHGCGRDFQILAAGSDFLQRHIGRPAPPGGRGQVDGMMRIIPAIRPNRDVLRAAGFLQMFDPRRHPASDVKPILLFAGAAGTGEAECARTLGPNFDEDLAAAVVNGARHAFPNTARIARVPQQGLVAGNVGKSLLRQ